MTEALPVIQQCACTLCLAVKSSGMCGWLQLQSQLLNKAFQQPNRVGSDRSGNDHELNQGQGAARRPECCYLATKD